MALTRLEGSHQPTKLNPTPFVVIHDLADLVTAYGKTPSKDYGMATHGHFMQGAIDGIVESLVVNGTSERNMTVSIQKRDVLQKRLERAVRRSETVTDRKMAAHLKGRIGSLRWVLGQ